MAATHTGRSESQLSRRNANVAPTSTYVLCRLLIYVRTVQVSHLRKYCASFTPTCALLCKFRIYLRAYEKEYLFSVTEVNTGVKSRSCCSGARGYKRESAVSKRNARIAPIYGRTVKTVWVLNSGDPNGRYISE